MRNGFVAAIISFSVYMLLGEATGAITYPCVKFVTVVEILSIEYRGGTILGDDGTTYDWSAHVVVGDEVCVKQEQKVDWTYSD